MSPRSFIVLTVLTAVTLVAAVVATVNVPAVSTVRLVNEPAFPVLRSNPDRVARLTLRTADAEFTLVREGKRRWVAPAKQNYPVSQEKLRKTIVELADMQLVEAKTSKPERFPRLEVEDPGAEGAKSRLVRLESEAGEVLAEALIGKRSARFTAGQDAGTYLRLADQDQAWLASGEVTLHDQLIEWLDKEFISVSGDEVRRIEVAPGQGQSYAAIRDDEAGELRLETRSDGRKLKAGVLNRLASAMSFVTMKDVAPRSDMQLPAGRATARLTTFAGVEVKAETAQVEDGHWMLVTARFTGEQDDTSEAAETARARVDAINDEVGGWAYRIDDYLAERLSTSFDDLFEAKDGTS